MRGKKGKLVTFEGIDGAGKSTMIDMLKKSGELSNTTVYTCEPTRETMTGKCVSQSMESNADPLTELFLFLADHAAHLNNTVIPAINSGKLVLSDRYSDSRIAYQGAALQGRIRESDTLSFVKRLHDPWTIVPDMTFVFDISPEISVQRCADRGKKTKFENTDFLKQVRTNFNTLAQKHPERIIIIDSTKPPEKNMREIIQKIKILCES